jgi:predicted metal-dependent phosphotriesterase family hydrolase
VKGGLARIVTMPTWDSENNVKKSKTPSRASIVVSREGELTPEAIAVIAAVATAQVRDSTVPLALATGHISANEVLLVIREARKQGIKKIVVTHAMGFPVNMSMLQMKQAVEMGAYIEFVGGFLIGEHAAFTIDQYYDAIRELGPSHVILSSDGGQVNRPFPDDMLALTAGQLRDKGMTAAELRTMLADNPADLLGLPRVSSH